MSYTKYHTQKEKDDAHRKQALEWYYRKKGITLESIQKKIDEKRKTLQKTENILQEKRISFNCRKMGNSGKQSLKLLEEYAKSL